MESAENEVDREDEPAEVEPEELENDPARDPDDDRLKDIKGG